MSAEVKRQRSQQTDNRWSTDFCSWSKQPEFFGFCGSSVYDNTLCPAGFMPECWVSHHASRSHLASSWFGPSRRPHQQTKRAIHPARVQRVPRGRPGTHSSSSPTITGWKVPFLTRSSSFLFHYQTWCYNKLRFRAGDQGGFSKTCGTAVVNFTPTCRLPLPTTQTHPCEVGAAAATAAGSGRPCYRTQKSSFLEVLNNVPVHRETRPGSLVFCLCHKLTQEICQLGPCPRSWNSNCRLRSLLCGLFNGAGGC